VRFVLLPQREATLIMAASRTGAQQAGAMARKARVHSSIAVLPFDNRSGDRSQDYFTGGLTIELTTSLARISALEVIASAVAVRLSPEEATRLTRSKIVEPKAYDEYVRGRSLWNQRFEPAGRERAIRIAILAAACDPLPHQGLGNLLRMICCARASLRRMTHIS
jgi:hypothetical protein